jgi:hypothetical protein
MHNNINMDRSNRVNIEGQESGVPGSIGEEIGHRKQGQTFKLRSTLFPLTTPNFTVKIKPSEGKFRRQPKN